MCLFRHKPSPKNKPSYSHGFTEEFGFTNCSDLLGCHLGTPEGQQTFKENRLHRRCMTYTGLAAELIDGAKTA